MPFSVGRSNEPLRSVSPVWSLFSDPFRRFAPALMLLAALAGTASASWIALAGGDEGASPDVRVIESTEARVVLDYTFPGFYADSVRIGESVYYGITMPGASRSLERGMQALPHLARSIVIPNDARMVARLVDVETIELRGLPVVPSKGNLNRNIDPDTVSYSFAASFVKKEWYPSQPAVLGTPYVLRDKRGVVVDLFPLRARGSDGTLLAARRMRIEIARVGVDDVNVIQEDGSPRAAVRDFEQIYARHFVNWDTENYTPVATAGPMLVIGYGPFHDALLPLIEWKNQEGMPTVLTDVSSIPGGNDPVAIKAYIQEMFDTEGLAYVLLVGDADQVASPRALDGASDPSYALTRGNDSYPDIFVGRYSAETVAQVQTQVARTIAYEKSPMAGADWYQMGMGVASNRGPGDDGEYDNEHADNIRVDLLGYGYTQVDRIYAPTGTISMVTAALNQGRGIVNYTGDGTVTGWATPAFSVSNVNALSNEAKLPFIISVACVNEKFDGGTCFAEAWLRATRNGNPTGAIAAYMSSVNQYWDPPMSAQDEITDLLIGDATHVIGALCYDGSCKMIDEYGADGADMFLTWHIFGDPSLLVRTKRPVAMIAEHDGTMAAGQTEYAVQVPGVNGALCALYGDGTLYGSAYTVGGTAAIHMDSPPLQPGVLTLTVTAYNKVPVLASVTILPPVGPFLSIASRQILDGQNGNEDGDGDGDGDAGETVNMSITLRNDGLTAATGVNASLAEEDPFVEILTGTQDFPDIPPGGQAASVGNFRMRLLPGAPDGHTAELRLAIQASEGAWERTFYEAIRAPILAWSAQSVDDGGAGGNGSGWIDPGEVVEISLSLMNSGQDEAGGVTADLMPGTPNVEILEGRGSAAGIPAGDAAPLSPFRIRISAECPLPAVLSMQASVAADHGYVTMVPFTISVGGFVDDLESDRGWTVGAPGDDAISGIWVRADPNGTVYNGQPIQPEDDHTPAPGTACYVTGNGPPGGSPGDNDVDGGKTTLLTPVLDLSRVASATVSYWFWFRNDIGNNAGEDYWDVQATSDGTTWVPLEHTRASTTQWTWRSFALESFVPLTAQVQLRFVASDEAGASYIEAALDDFSLTAVMPVAEVEDGAPAVVASGVRILGPNPARGTAEVGFAAPFGVPTSLGIYDVSGRLVRNLFEGAAAGVEMRMRWDGRNESGRLVGSGVYFLRMRSPGFGQVRRLTFIG